ncbi:hypothetical protein RDI58_028896 [Solanum bulbocastanum]|uniref:Uncharacterized protein n=1 Tax=Solanum bulbocastanum TaxID=147425 RepID=A0AAN8SQX9_SOLBU
MTTLLVFIHYNSEWDGDNNFVNYSMEGVVVNTDVVFNGFIQLIAKHLNVDTSLNSLEIRYKLDETTIPNGAVDNVNTHFNINDFNTNTLDLVEYSMSARETAYFEECAIIESVAIEIPAEAHRAKLKALQLVRGDPADSYAEIPSYLHMLKQSNPGSFVSLRKTPEGHFLYAFAALNSSIKG